jgi:Zn-dependent peptidase ImmA (M78 family)/DNA-binding XRE family transcriptional regulator
MSEANAWISQAIRSRRMARGWNQSELARRLGRTQTAVSFWESGKRTPGIDDLIEVAAAFEVGASELLPPVRPTPALLRATAERLADTDLEKAIDELVVAAESVSLAPAAIEVMAKSPVNAANELLEKAEVSEPPVEIEELAVRCGAVVFNRHFPDSLSGLVFVVHDRAMIGINKDHHSNRRRFSLAHELGHFVLGHHLGSSDEVDSLHIDTDEGHPPGFDWHAERAANDFAAELLMPRRLMSAAFERSQDPSELADQFKVSRLAMGYRLVNLGLR